MKKINCAVCNEYLGKYDEKKALFSIHIPKKYKAGKKAFIIPAIFSCNIHTENKYTVNKSSFSHKEKIKCEDCKREIAICSENEDGIKYIFVRVDRVVDLWVWNVSMNCFKCDTLYNYREYIKGTWPLNGIVLDKII